MRKNYQNESGRSMVEMLGVLAVIGVLSVAGIAGYSNAMRQYRANVIVNAISTLYVMGMAQNQGQGTGTMNYSDIGTNPSGATLVYTNKTITASITDENDCKMVKNKLGDKADGNCPSLTVSFEETETEKSTTCIEGRWDCDDGEPHECLEGKWNVAYDLSFCCTPNNEKIQLGDKRCINGTYKKCGDAYAEGYWQDSPLPDGKKCEGNNLENI